MSETCSLHLRAGLVALLSSWPAQALAGGVLVRLDADRELEGDVVVVLRPASGDPEEVGLQDDGTQPDVTAGDGMWAGAAYLPHAEVDVEVRIGDDTFPGGTATWSDAGIPRDLDLSLQAGTLLVNAREANPHGEGNGPSSDAPGPDGGSGNSSSSAKKPTDRGDEASGGLFMIAGGGMALLVLALVMWSGRGRTPREKRPSTGLQLQPPGGFAGPLSPSLVDGLTYWTLPESDPAGALRAVVRRLAEHHSVLVVGSALPDRLGAPGAAVFTTAPDKARRIGDYLEALHKPRRRRAVVVFYGVEQDAEAWAEQDDELPIGSGGVALLARSGSGPDPSHDIELADDRGWRVRKRGTDDHFALSASTP